MFGPNLHGDAAAGGASKIDLLAVSEAGPASLWSEPRPVGRHPPARQTERDEAESIDQSLSPSNDWQFREHFSLITILLSPPPPPPPSPAFKIVLIIPGESCPLSVSVIAYFVS